MLHNKNEGKKLRKAEKKMIFLAWFSLFCPLNIKMMKKMEPFAIYNIHLFTWFNLITSLASSPYRQHTEFFIFNLIWQSAVSQSVSQIGDLKNNNWKNRNFSSSNWSQFFVKYTIFLPRIFLFFSFAAFYFSLVFLIKTISQHGEPSDDVFFQSSHSGWFYLINRGVVLGRIYGSFGFSTEGRNSKDRSHRKPKPRDRKTEKAKKEGQILIK